MSTCLHPIYLKIDNRPNVACTGADLPKRFRMVRPYAVDVLPVPCGKCIECLKARQNAVVTRCMAESQKRGSFGFVTLTYNDDNLPIAQSLWRASKETGECEVVFPAEVVCRAGESSELRSRVLSLPAGNAVRYYDTPIDGFETSTHVYFSRLTPSVCRLDVRLWLKRARVRYERENGVKLDFSYALEPEYGPRTNRPHYHLAFFGLDKNTLDWLVSQWTFGFTESKMVNRVNSDGSDGFQIASRYIGKYISKGKFDCESVKLRCSEKPRLCQSVHLGESLVERLRPHVLCFDMYGPYDLDNLFCPSLGRCFTDNELKQITSEIPKRLSYCVSGNFRLPLPRVFRQKLLCKKEKKEFYSFDAENPSKVETIYRTVYTPTTLWRLCVAALQDRLSLLSNREFLSRISGVSPGALSSRVREIATNALVASSFKESNAESRYLQFLQNSFF